MSEHASASNQAQSSPTPAAAIQVPQQMPEPEIMPLLQGLYIQPKLTVGAPDDPLEDEADAVAEQVMRMPEAPFASSVWGKSGIQCKAANDGDQISLSGIIPGSFVQLKCSECEEEEEGIQRKAILHAITPFIQAKGDGAGTASPQVTQQIMDTKGGGSSLPGSTRSFMESRFGADFSDVRIHTGDYASSLSGNLNAHAFTVGSDIYFNDSKFAPGTDAGDRLLAHELTHTIQQGTSAQRSIQREVILPGDAEVQMTSLLPVTVHGQSFNSAAQELAAMIDRDDIRNSARIMVAIGNSIHVYDGLGAATGNPVRLISPIPMGNGVFQFSARRGGTGGSFARIWLINNRPTLAPEGHTDTQHQRENVNIQDYIVASDREALSTTLGSNAYWFLVIPGDVSLSTGRRTPPQWAVAQASRVLQRMHERQGQGSGAGSGSGQGDGSGSSEQQTAPTPDRTTPERIVPWSNEHGDYVNAWKNGYHVALRLAEGESDETLEHRIEQSLERAYNAHDFNQSTRVAGGAESTSVAPPANQSQMPGSGRPANPDQQRLVINDAQRTANLPAYSARIDSDIREHSTVLGANNHMQMVLDYTLAGSDTLSQVAARMQSINYYWEIIKVSDAELSSASEEYARTVATDPEHRQISSLDASLNEVGRHERAILSDAAADIWRIPESGPLAYMTANLMVLSVGMRTIGNLFSSFVSVVSRPLNDQNIGWNDEGNFFVRCIATPSHSEDAEYRRASSVAVQFVRVVNINRRAQEAAQAPQAAATDPSSNIETVREVIRYRADRSIEISPAARALHAQLLLNDVDPAAYLARMQQQQGLMTRMQNFRDQQLHLAKPGTTVYQPRAALVSEENGSVNQLALYLFQTSDSTDAHPRYRMIDVSSPGTQGYYSGSSTTAGAAGHTEAMRNAFVAFSENNGYGRGAIALHFTQTPPEGVQFPVNGRSAPGEHRRWMQRLTDLAEAAGIVALFLSGGAAAIVGGVAGIAGAAVAADSLITAGLDGRLRGADGRFHLDWETSQQIIAVIGGILPALGLIRSMQGVVHIIGIAQFGHSVIAVPVNFLRQLDAINMDLAATPGDRAARQAQAFAEALKGGVIVVLTARQMAMQAARPTPTASEPRAAAPSEPQAPSASEPQVSSASEPQVRATGEEPPVAMVRIAANGTPEIVPPEHPATPEEPSATQQGQGDHPAIPADHPRPAPAHPVAEGEPSRPAGQSPEPSAEGGGEGPVAPVPAAGTRPPRVPAAILRLQAFVTDLMNAQRARRHEDINNEATQERIMTAEAQRAPQIATANPRMVEIAVQAIREIGNFKTLRQLIGEGFFLSETTVAREAIQAARRQIVTEAQNQAFRAAREYLREHYPDLNLHNEPIDMGTPGFGSDSDITMRFSGGNDPRAVRAQIEASIHAVQEAYRILREQGYDADAALDTNFYTELHEGSIRPEGPLETAQITHDQSVVSLAEQRMGMSGEQWANYRERQLESVRQAVDAGPEALARTTAELNAAEALAARIRPEGQTATQRRALLDSKMNELRAALERNAPARETRQLMAEIKLLEPEAYGTRAAVESVVGRQQRMARGNGGTYHEIAALPTDPHERAAFLAQDANAQNGMLHAHTAAGGNTVKHIQSGAKYLRRIIHDVVVDGHLPEGDGGAFFRNLNDIVNTKNITDSTAVTTETLRLIREALIADGRDPALLDRLTPETMRDMWAEQAREYGNQLSIEMRTEESLINAESPGELRFSSEPPTPERNVDDHWDEPELDNSSRLP